MVSLAQKCFAGCILPRGFTQDAEGLWYRPPGEDNDSAERIWICGPLQVIAETADDKNHNHGLLLSFVNRFGHAHKWAMPWRLVHEDGNAIAAALQDAGLRCGTSRHAHERLKQFLGQVRVHRRVRCVDQAGWHGSLYVLPDGRVIPSDADGIVLQTERAVVSGAYSERRTLQEWRYNIARLAIGNDFLVLSMSLGFAAPLLDVTGDPSGGLHLYGPSQSGKTTLLRCTLSIIGPSDKHMRTWRATANGLEAVAAETNDGMLGLDELSQIAGRAGGACPQQWRVTRNQHAIIQ
jgi:uncharacterized protein (DUF927 family)